MTLRLKFIVLHTLIGIFAVAGTAMAQGATAELGNPTGGVEQASVKFLPSTATDSDGAIEVFDVEIINPSAFDLMIDQIAVTFSGSASARDLRAKASVSGDSSPTFVGTDNLLVFGVDPAFSISTSATSTGANLLLGPTTEVFSTGITANGTADFLKVAPDDTVTVTVSVWSVAATNLRDGISFTADILNPTDPSNSGMVLDNGGEAIGTDKLTEHINIVTQTAVTIVSTVGDPGGLGTAINVPSTATSISVAVPVFQFKIIDDDDDPNTPNLRPTRIDGLTIPIVLANGMDPSDIAGASLEILSSLPDNLIQFSPTVGGDREINTSADPAYITLTTDGNDLVLRAGFDASVGTANDGVADLLELPDPDIAAIEDDRVVSLEVSIWLDNSDLSNNSTATFDLTASGVTLDGPGTNSDVISINADVDDAVATIFTATNENSSLLDRGDVADAVTLPSSATDLGTAFDVFDFSIVDGIGGDVTKIDSISIPVTLRNNAKFSDLEGARLTIESAGIIFAFNGGSSISTVDNPTLVSIDSVNTTQANITFKGQAVIDTTDALADLVEIPQNDQVAFTLAVWIGTTNIEFGSILSFDLQNDDIVLTALSSDALADDQNVTDGVATISLTQLQNHETVADAVTVSTAFSGGSSSLPVFDFKIVDDPDGKPTLIDFLQIPITVGGGASLSDIAEVRMTVSDLSIASNELAGSGSATISTTDGDGANGGATDPLVLDIVDSALEAGVGAGGFTLDINDAGGSAELLSIPDGETAIITISLAINQDGITDGSTLTFDIGDINVDVDDDPGTTDAVAAGQDVTDGVATLRAATLQDVATVGDSVFVSTSVQTEPGVAAFDFKITDPVDGKPTIVDGVFIPWAFTGAALSDVGGITVDVKIDGAAASIPDDAMVGGDNDGTIVSGTDPSVIGLTAGGVEIGSDGTVGGGMATGNGDGTAGFFSLPDGSVAVVTVNVFFTSGELPLNGDEIVEFGLVDSNVAVDTQAGASGGIATGQEITNGTLLVSNASTQLTDSAEVASLVTVSSTSTMTPGIDVFDFVIQDLDATDGGSNSPTTIDGLVIPITLSGMELAGIGGFRVTESGSVSGFDAGAGKSDTDNDGVLDTSTGDLGIEFVDNGDGTAELRLGAAAAGVPVNSGNGTAELIAAKDATDDGNFDNPLTITVSMWLATSGIDDNGTVTLSLASTNLLQDNTNDLVVESQVVTNGVVSVNVSATQLIFTAPAATLARNARSDTVKVKAVDANYNVDKDFTGTIVVSTDQMTTGAFRTVADTGFAGVGASLSGTATDGVLSFFYRDSNLGVSTLTATSAALTSTESDDAFAFTIIASRFSVAWTNPALGTSTQTDSAGTFHLLQYAIANNDPNLLVEFWADQDSTLGTITDDSRSLKIYNPDQATVLGNLRNPDADVFGPGTDGARATDIEVNNTSLYIWTTGLGAGTWYVYMVEADGDGASSGGDTLARSGGLDVLHFPNVIAFGVADTTSIAAEVNFERDSGGNDPNRSMELLLYAEDHDSNDDIEIYISTNANLAASQVKSDVNTVQVAGNSNWKINDVGDTLRTFSVDISDSLGTSAFHPKGNHYFYVRIQDAATSTVAAFARAQTLGGLQQTLAVKHSPFLAFSEPAADVVDHSVASEPNIILAWNGSGAAGDQDIDDNASISLWFADASVTPTTFADTSATLMRITSGGIREDPDGGAEDQHAWDLTEFDGNLPPAGDSIFVWALLDDGGGTPVYISSPPITFATYQPLLALLNPPPGAATEILESDTYRFFFDADYVSNTKTNGTVRFLISSENTTDPSVFTFDTGASSTFPGDYNAFWISSANELKEGVDAFFDWSPKNDGNNYATEIVPLTDANSTFYVYALINTTGASINNPDGLTLALAQGQILVNGIGSVAAVSGVGASPNKAQVAAGDTVRVLLRGNTGNTPVQGIQLYVNVDTTEFAIVDQDGTTAGTQPFGWESSYFFGDEVAQVNRLTVVDSLFKLDLDKRNLIALQDPTDQLIAFVDVVAKDFSGAATVNWNMDAVNDPNRLPVLFNSSGVLTSSFTNPLVTFTSVSRGTITGTVPLEGNARTHDSKVTTFWLRVPGSWVSLSDSNFIAANDTAMDTSIVDGAQLIAPPDSSEALQVLTGADGSFTLTQVPSGTYELVAKPASYLAGFTTVTVVDGQSLTGVLPTAISTSNDPSQLLGGDLNNDNKIDADDESAMNLAYAATTIDSNFSSVADIDDDGSVLLSDLLILAANRQIPVLSGIDPVYKPVPGINEGAMLTLAGLPAWLPAGEEMEVELRLERTDEVKGYTLDLVYDPAALDVVGVDASLLNSASTVRVNRLQRPGRFVLAEVTRGRATVASEEGPLARVRLRALSDVSPVLAVERAFLADRANRTVQLAVQTSRILPQRFALAQNSPNPFNPSTNISFDLPQDSAPVSLTVYNLMGQRVRELIRAETMPLGSYTITWDGLDGSGKRAGSGVYLYTLAAGPYLESRKMILMK